MRKQRSYQRYESVPSPNPSAKPRVLNFRPHSTYEPFRKTPEPAMTQQVETCIEVLCQKGCLSVRADIRALEQGQHLPETAGLSREAIRLVLKELKGIMAVYGDSCRIG